MNSSKILSQAFLQTLWACLILLTTPSSTVAHQPSLKLSTISASPAVLPFPQPPSSTPALAEPPALSPDITPLFPTPAGSKATPAPVESSLPIIPSSPSPPNPDDSISSPEPETAVPPTGSLPESSAVAFNPSGSSMALLLLLLALHLVPSRFAFWTPIRRCRLDHVRRVGDYTTCRGYQTSKQLEFLA